MPKTSEFEIKALYERYVEEFWNEQQPEVLDEIFSPDFVMHEGDKEFDREEYKGFLEEEDALFSDIELEIEDMRLEGDTLASRVTAYVTADGNPDDIEDYEPSGDRLEYVGMSFMRVEDGVFVEEWLQADKLGLYTKAGLINPP